MATLDQVIDQMLGADMPPLPPGHPVLDGRIHRFGPKNKAWYVLHEFVARNQKRYVAGAFGIWRGTENNATKVTSDFTGIDPEEFKRLQATQDQLALKEQHKREARAKFAAGRASEQWKKARARLDAGEQCEYLVRKRLHWEPKGMRMTADGTLLIPMVRYDVTEAQAQDPEYNGPRRLAGLQKIAKDGSKLFNKGMDPVGAACRFGRAPKDGDLLLVGEGLATVLSVHQALERAYPSFVAFTAGNLVPVARILRKQFPKSPILFLADDDAYLEAQLNKRLRDDYGIGEIFRADQVEKTMAGKTGPVLVRANLHEDAFKTPILTAGITIGEKLRPLVLKNAGRAKAWEAATEIGAAWVCFPEFKDRELKPDPDGPRLTDFNDLHVAEGVQPLIAQVGSAIKDIESAHQLARSMAAGAPAAASGKKGGGGDGAEPDWETHGSMLRRFTQIYPTDEAYDAERGTLVKVNAIRLRFGSKSTNMWLASPRKRIVDEKNVVFDPTETSDRKTTINLFRGLPIKAGEGNPTKCPKLLELLQFLCGEAGQDLAPVTEWVLKWIAYQLQHVGAKMQTAVVMHGEEGAGKNLFWGAVRAMFGDHGGTITQQQLESDFNEWLSAQLFIIANEVVTQQHKRHHVGYLKNLITEPRVWINPKNLRPRYEANHANIVFLSNELQALQLGVRDRRYMVIRTPAALEREFYAAAAAEADAGGVAALYQYLLELELGDFNEHTKPLVTEAKDALIELGMNAAQLFWQELKDGLIGLPYCPALVEDVYRCYVAWCARNGEKMPQRINLFTPNFMSMNGVRRVKDRIPNPALGQRSLTIVADAEGATLKQRKIFIMGARDPDPDAEKVRIRKGTVEFHSAMQDYVGGSHVHGDANDRERAL